MQGNNKRPLRSLFGVTLGVLLWTISFTNFPAGGFLNLIGAGMPITATAAEPQGVSPAYRAGRQAGRADARRDLPRNPTNYTWTTRQESRDYQAGYYRGYSEGLDSSQYDRRYTRDDRRFREDYGRTFDRNDVSLNIGRDNVVRWEAPETVRVYVRMDNEPMKLFAEGASGSQAAPWIMQGHIYDFVAFDLN